MLDLLDSVIAFVAILLGVSLVITVLVQSISGLFNLRGLALVKGLKELLEQAELGTKDAKALADKILCHPMISDSILPKQWTFFARASAIRKDELTRMLTSASAFGLVLTTEADKAKAKAKFEHAKQVAEDWFDGKMDRASQVFAQSSRIVTIVVSFVVAFALHLDASALLSRVSSNTELRGKLVASVDGLQKKAEEIQKREEEKTPLALGDAVAEAKALQGDLASSGLDFLPKFGKNADLPNGIHTACDYLNGTSEGFWHLLGILAGGAFLSLGAPFWFNILKQLTNLRTVLANKEHAEREDQPKPAGSGTATT